MFGETMIRRSSLEIDMDVLRAIELGESKPTRLMYGCNLSWKSIGKTLEKLVDSDLVLKTFHSGNKRTKRTYTITDKGVNALVTFKEIKSLLR